MRISHTTSMCTIRTVSGRLVHPLALTTDEVSVTDIAHALSHQCRFGGHTREFYSVAEHSVRVSWACDQKDALWGLLHDAAEAYMVDVPSPLKDAIPEIREIESQALLAICREFHLPPEMPPSVHVADRVLLATEQRDLMMYESDGGESPLADVIRPWMPVSARFRFLERYAALTGTPIKWRG